MAHNPIHGGGANGGNKAIITEKERLGLTTEQVTSLL